MISVYTAASMLDAQLVADALMAAGLEAHVHGGYLSGAIGELPPSTLISVWITDEGSTEKARQIIEAFEQDLTRRIARSDAVLSCKECQEVSSATFTHCWQCGALLPDPISNDPSDTHPKGSF